MKGITDDGTTQGALWGISPSEDPIQHSFDNICFLLLWPDHEDSHTTAEGMTLGRQVASDIRAAISRFQELPTMAIDLAAGPPP